MNTNFLFTQWFNDHFDEDQKVLSDEESMKIAIEYLKSIGEL